MGTSLCTSRPAPLIYDKGVGVSQVLFPAVLQRLSCLISRHSHQYPVAVLEVQCSEHHLCCKENILLSETWCRCCRLVCFSTRKVVAGYVIKKWELRCNSSQWLSPSLVVSGKYFCISYYFFPLSPRSSRRVPLLPRFKFKEHCVEWSSLCWAHSFFTTSTRSDTLLCWGNNSLNIAIF